MIQDKVKKQVFEAMKAKEEVRLSTLRMLSSALHNMKIDNPNMSEEDELKVVASEAKKRKDAIDALRQASSFAKASKDKQGSHSQDEIQQRIDREKKELEILEGYLPEQMSDEEIEAEVVRVIEQVGAKGMGDMGKVMGVVMAEMGGKADGNIVSKIVAQKLS